jgi:polyribonucleotide nucleotidyltransferase
MTETNSVTAAFTRGEGKDATFEIGKFAPLAGGSVTASIGNTVVLVTATGAKTARENADFFPLTVDIEERMYAAGKIPGSFFRREARAGEQAILTCRLVPIKKTPTTFWRSTLRHWPCAYRRSRSTARSARCA